MEYCLVFRTPCHRSCSMLIWYDISCHPVFSHITRVPGQVIIRVSRSWGPVRDDLLRKKSHFFLGDQSAGLRQKSLQETSMWGKPTEWGTCRMGRDGLHSCSSSPYMDLIVPSPENHLWKDITRELVLESCAENGCSVVKALFHTTSSQPEVWSSS